jgi:hypothetical protein
MSRAVMTAFGAAAANATAITMRRIGWSFFLTATGRVQGYRPCWRPVFLARCRVPPQRQVPPSAAHATVRADRSFPGSNGAPCRSCSPGRSAGRSPAWLPRGVSVGSSTVTAYSSVSGRVRVHRSTRCRFSRAPWKSVFALKVSVPIDDDPRPFKVVRTNGGHWEDRTLVIDVTKVLHW